MRRKPKNTLRKKIACLGFIIVIELVIAFFLWDATKPRPNHGFIIKNGRSYVLVWRNQDNSLENKNYAFLHEALDFASQELRLKVGRNPNFPESIEGVWERTDIGKNMVFWKTAEFDFVHRLTFHRVTEAKVFADAFRRGAYSPSPYGNSIFLTPVQ